MTTALSTPDDGASWDVRPMAIYDVEAAIGVIEKANAPQEATGSRPPPAAPDSADDRARRLAHARFVERDGPGAWVAASDGKVVGVAESIRRGDFWGLSMLFVDPDFQSRGIGGRLVAAAMGYADGASRRMIMSSPDPRAMRRYFLAGLTMHPAADVTGRPDRRSIPASLAGRSGGREDLDLVASVDAQLGRSRAEDVAFALGDDRFRLDVVDTGPGRGWVLWRPGRLLMLGATDEQTATVLMWRCIAGSGEGRSEHRRPEQGRPEHRRSEEEDVGAEGSGPESSEGEIVAYGLTAAQQWAFAVAHEARLTVRVGGAVFVAGMSVPGPWIPSGWYF